MIDVEDKKVEYRIQYVREHDDVWHYLCEPSNSKVYTKSKPFVFYFESEARKFVKEQLMTSESNRQFDFRIEMTVKTYLNCA
jgi:hypothetical protein